MDAALNKHLQSEIINRLQSSNCHDEFVKEFSQCTTDYQRISCLYKTCECQEIIQAQKKFRDKDKREAEILRAEGNAFFKEKQYFKAHRSYTRSILKAPNDSENLSLAYNNRSLTNFYLKRYALCLQDIELAFLHNYSKTSCYKLYQRMGRCMYYLQHKDEAIKAFQQTIITLACADIQDDVKQEMVEDMNRAISQCSAIKGKPLSVSVREYNHCHQSIPSLPSDCSNEVPCLSDAVEVKLDRFGGRGLFARKDIQIGDVVIVENPYASVLLKQFNTSHCHYCCNRLQLAIPCQQCSGVAFCSLNCRDSAWKKFHWAECQILERIQDTKGDLGLLATRMILTTGYETLINIQDYKDVERLNGFGEDGVYRSDDYKSCYSLVHHVEDRTFNDLFSRTVSAVYFLKHLELAGFFPKCDENVIIDSECKELSSLDASTGENQKTSKLLNGASPKTVLDKNTLVQHKCMVGGHILRNLMMLPCNAHEVSELALNRDHPAMSVTEELAAAIYPVLSLINHSCDPSVVRHSFGNICVARAIRSIKSGEELKDNYGALYPTMMLETRQEEMKSQYFFSCNCEACVSNWPQYFEIPCEVPVFRCKQCDGRVMIPCGSDESKCTTCGKLQDVSPTLMQMGKLEPRYKDTLESVIDGNNSSENITILLSYLRLVEGKLHRPWRDINDCQEAFKQCLNMQANCYPLGLV